MNNLHLIERIVPAGVSKSDVVAATDSVEAMRIYVAFLEQHPNTMNPTQDDKFQIGLIPDISDSGEPRIIHTKPCKRESLSKLLNPTGAVW